MEDYPGWLVDRVASTLYAVGTNSEVVVTYWKGEPEWVKDSFREDARAVLNVLNYRELLSHPGYWAGPATREKTDA